MFRIGEMEDLAEKRIGLIPNASTNSKGRDEGCAILVTDRRLIASFDYTPQSFKGGIKSYFGKEADAPPAPPQAVDYGTVDLDELARKPQNISIPFFAMDNVKFDTTIGVSSLEAKYHDEAGKGLVFFALLVPSDALISKRKAEGIGRRDTIKGYGLKCKELLKRALPPSLAQNLG